MLCAEATRQGLLARGWVENADSTSAFFDLKWTVRAVDIDIPSLLPGQIVNHFHMSERFTTKAGLLQCLHDMRWTADLDMHAVFPRCYDLSTPDEKHAFIEVMRSLTSVMSVIHLPHDDGISCQRNLVHVYVLQRCAVRRPCLQCSSQDT